MVLKTFPLFLPLRGILHQRRYTYQWSSMFILLYVIEGSVRATTDAMPSRAFAMAELALAASFFVACVFAARGTRRQTGNASPGA